MWNDYHVEFTRGKLRDIVHGRILMLSVEEVAEFLPDSDWLYVKDFVTHVQKMVRQRVVIREFYTKEIQTTTLESFLKQWEKG